MSRARRVLFLDHTAALGGGEIALLHLVRHLDPARYTPTVIVFSDGPLVERLRESGIECQIMPVSPELIHARKDSLGTSSLLRLKSIFTAVGFARRLSRVIRDGGFHLVHTNSLKSDLIGGLAARLAGKPVVWHVRDRISADYLPAKVAWVFRRLARVIPHFVVANSRATLDTLTSRPGRSRMRVVLDGTPLVASAADAAPLSDPPRVGLIGRISPWKGQHVFLAAAAEVRKAQPRAKFLLIGSALFSEDSYEKQLHERVANLGLSEAVEFTGFRSDVAAAIASLDILVHASTVPEPFGQVVIEGMALARPVIATAGGGVLEIITDNQTGLLVPMNDAPAMAAAITRLLNDPALAHRLATAGQAHARNHFSITRVAAEIMDVFDTLLTPAPQQPTPVTADHQPTPR